MFFFSLFFVAIFSSLLYTNMFFLIALNLYMFFIISNVNIVEANYIYISKKIISSSKASFDSSLILILFLILILILILTNIFLLA